jgi:O-antigen ligase
MIRKKWRRLALLSAIIPGALVIGIGLIVVSVKLPWPDPLGGFSTAELLSERAAKFTGEAGASSRWALWPELIKEIKAAPIFGQGFGATVTYISSDPRVLSESPTGEYTTFAFEWGWLDIWLKIGLFGLAAYLALMSKIIYAGLKAIGRLDFLIAPNTAALLVPALIFGLAALSAVNFFSPYFNHPLGIGFLIITALAVEKLPEKNKV